MTAMEAVSTGLNIRFPSTNTFNASPPITSIPPCTTSMFLQQYPHRSFPRLSFIQRPHVFEKPRTSSRRQPRGIVCSMKKLAETEAIPLEENPKSLAEKLPYATGVYAMHDKSGELQFIGISRMVADSVLNHLRDVPQLCGSVKIALVDVPDRTALTDAWKVWMEEHINAIGKVPPGNESGSTIWVKKRQTKPDLRLTPGRHVQLTVTLEQLIDKLVKENEIVVFIKGSRMAPQCGFSHKVLTILNEHGLDYESVNILDEDYNPGLRETLKVYSSWPTFPQVFIKGEFVGGADILTEMAEKGELQECLKSKK